MRAGKKIQGSKNPQIHPILLFAYPTLNPGDAPDCIQNKAPNIGIAFIIKQVNIIKGIQARFRKRETERHRERDTDQRKDRYTDRKQERDTDSQIDRD